MYTNADQLINKREDLLCAISDDQPDVIFITECIPKAQLLPISLALLDLPGYNLMINFDANEPHLGSKGIRGICVYLKDGFHGSEVSLLNMPLIEQMWIKITLMGTDQLIAGCIYRSPSSDPDQSIEQLSHIFHAVTTAGYSHVLVCGDFNMPQIGWANNFCALPPTHFAHMFLNIVHDCLLFQHVTHPTRYRQGYTPSTLDLVLTNEEGMISDLEYQPGLGKSDHVVLRFLKLPNMVFALMHLTLICYPLD